MAVVITGLRSAQQASDRAWRYQSAGSVRPFAQRLCEAARSTIRPRHSAAPVSSLRSDSCYTLAMRHCTLLLVALACTVASTAQRTQAQPLLNPWQRSRADDLKIALVTFGPGDGIVAAFGHNALLVEDQARGQALLYNFGMFSFGMDMLRDIIDRAIGGQFHQALDRPARLTYRGHTRRYAQANPVFEFALTFWMNDSIDRPLKAWDELFLPQELERAIDRLRYVDARGQRTPLLRAKHVVFEAVRAPVSNWPATRWPEALLLGCACGALFVLAASWRARSGRRLARIAFGALHVLLGLTFGLLGTIGFLIWTLTEHSVAYHNENQWLANPITLLALPLGIAITVGSVAGLRLARGLFAVSAAMSLLLCGLKALPSFDQDNALPIALLLPIYLGGLWAHQLLARTNATESVLPEPIGA